MKQSITRRATASGATAIVAALALGASATPSSAASSLTPCPTTGPIARTLKVHGTTCADGRALAKAWQRGQNVRDQGSRFTLRGYACRMRTTRTTAGDKEGTAHFDCRTGKRRVVFTYHP